MVLHTTTRMGPPDGDAALPVPLEVTEALSMIGDDVPLAVTDGLAKLSHATFNNRPPDNRTLACFAASMLICMYVDAGHSDGEGSCRRGRRHPGDCGRYGPPCRGWRGPGGGVSCTAECRLPLQ